MASVTSVISIFVLLLAAYCSSLPVNPTTDGSIEVTTGKTMEHNEFHLATDEESKKMPNIHPPRASAERDSGEAATTEQPATTNQDTSSPMTPTSKIPSTEKLNGKRAYLFSYPSWVRLYNGNLATGSVLTDGTILTHGPIYTDSSLVSYVTSYRRGLKDDPSTPETPTTEGGSSTDKPKDKRDYILDRSLVSIMQDGYGRLFEVESPLSKHLVLTPRDLKDEPSTSETPSTDNPKNKRDYILDRSLVSIMQDGYGRLFEVESPLSKHLVLTPRDLKDEPSTSETPSKEEGSSTDKPKNKRDYILQHNLVRLMSDSRGQLYQVASPFSEHVVLTTRDLKDIPSTSETPSKEEGSSTDKPKNKRDYILDRSLVSIMHDGFGGLYEVESPISKQLVLTPRDLKDEPSTPETPSTDNPKNKRALYYEDSSLVRLADGTIGRGSILSHGSVLPGGLMLTHGPIYANRNMLVRDPMFIDGAVRTFVSVNTRGIKDQTKDKDVSKEEKSPMTGDNLATTMETSTDFEPRAIKPMDGQSGEETSTFRPNENKKVKDGSSEETNARLPQKQQHSGEIMSNISDKIKQQKVDVNVPGSKQPIIKA